jgi:hypothetical protein
MGAQCLFVLPPPLEPSGLFARYAGVAEGERENFPFPPSAQRRRQKIKTRTPGMGKSISGL